MSDFEKRFKERLTKELNQQYQMFESKGIQQIEFTSFEQPKRSWMWLQLAMIPMIIILSLYGANLLNNGKYRHYRSQFAVIDVLKFDDASTYHPSFEEVVKYSTSIVFVEFIKFELLEYEMELKEPFFAPGVYNMIETIAHFKVIEPIKGHTEEQIEVTIQISFQGRNPWDEIEMLFDAIPIPEFSSNTHWLLFLQDKSNDRYRYFPFWTYQIINGSVVSQYSMEQLDKNRDPDAFTGLSSKWLIDQIRHNIRK